MSGEELIDLSQKFVYLTKTGKTEEAETIITTLETASLASLNSSLASDSEVKTFWINIYNGFSIYLLSKAPNVLNNPITRLVHFRSRKILIDRRKISLDDIEHGILRRSKVWWAQGYFKKPLVSAFEKNYRVKQLDYRIHFALNCGEESCPPIRFYEPDKIDNQLTLATQAFLEGESSYNEEAKTVSASKILKWYKGDFGGNKGILQLLKKYGIVPPNSNPKLILL